MSLIEDTDFLVFSSVSAVRLKRTGSSSKLFFFLRRLLCFSISLIEIQLTENVAFVAGVQQNDSIFVYIVK